MSSNLNITLQSPCLTEAVVQVQYSKSSYLGFIYFKTTFASLEIKFLPIQLIIPFDHNIIDKISLLVLKGSSKPTSTSHSSFTFCFLSCLNRIQF